ncbi:hypothetical protein LUQ84_002738 [Hamiltosporidium tvaerminnensis]|nr:hypothetical protein LUQ84_002738 [Hamiltosporidium tvaerminnensis]
MFLNLSSDIFSFKQEINFRIFKFFKCAKKFGFKFLPPTISNCKSLGPNLLLLSSKSDRKEIVSEFVFLFLSYGLQFFSTNTSGETFFSESKSILLSKTDSSKILLRLLFSRIIFPIPLFISSDSDVTSRFIRFFNSNRIFTSIPCKSTFFILRVLISRKAGIFINFNKAPRVFISSCNSFSGFLIISASCRIYFSSAMGSCSKSISSNPKIFLFLKKNDKISMFSWNVHAWSKEKNEPLIILT